MKTKTFGATLEEYMEAKGISRGELAHRMKMSHSRVHQILGSKSLTEATVNKCAKALGVEARLVLARKAKKG